MKKIIMKGNRKLQKINECYKLVYLITNRKCITHRKRKLDCHNWDDIGTDIRRCTINIVKYLKRTNTEMQLLKKKTEIVS